MGECGLRGAAVRISSSANMQLNVHHWKRGHHHRPHCDSECLPPSQGHEQPASHNAICSTPKDSGDAVDSEDAGRCAQRWDQRVGSIHPPESPQNWPKSQSLVQNFVGERAMRGLQTQRSSSHSVWTPASSILSSAVPLLRHHRHGLRVLSWLRMKPA